VNISRGLFFGDSSSYAVVDDSRHAEPPTFRLSTFSVWSSFSATVVFRAATPDALLLTAWQSPNCFASLGLVGGQVLARSRQSFFFYLRHFLGGGGGYCFTAVSV